MSIFERVEGDTFFEWCLYECHKVSTVKASMPKQFTKEGDPCGKQTVQEITSAGS